jgi:biopolymer transport protein ExbD
MAFNLTNGIVASTPFSLRPKSAKQSTEILFDLAPLVDIVFTLILFFMLTSPLITHWGVQVNLPSARHIAPLKQTEIEVTITADNRILLAGETYQLGPQLEKTLLRLAERNQPVAIICDTAADFGTVLGVWDAAKGAEIKSLNIRARVKTSE